MTFKNFSSREFMRLLETNGLTGNWGWLFAEGEHVWSPGLFHLLGLDPRAVKPSYDRLLSVVHPEDQNDLETASHVVQAGFLRNSTVRAFRADGSLRVLSLRNEVYYDADGRPRAAAGTVLDVTEKERLAALEQIERRRRRALFTQTQSWSHAALYRDGQRYASPEMLHLTGLRQEDFQNDCLLVLSPETRARGQAHITEMLQVGRPFVTNKHIALADGDTAIFRFVYAPIRGPQDEILSWATMASRLDGPKASPLDNCVRNGLESGIMAHHFRAARGLLGWSMTDFAKASGLSVSSIRRLEDDAEGLATRNRHTAVAALRRFGIGFLLTENSSIAVFRE